MEKDNANIAWEKSVDECVTNLNKEDKQVLKTLSKLLGQTDSEGQISQIEITQNFIDIQIKNAQEEMISMNYVVPTILKWSGINNLSYYYNYMLSMKKNLPIVSSYDAYIDVNNNIYRYEEESPYTNLINGYLYMEYNNLEKPRRQELFEVTQ